MVDGTRGEPVIAARESVQRQYFNVTASLIQFWHQKVE